MNNRWVAIGLLLLGTTGAASAGTLESARELMDAGKLDEAERVLEPMVRNPANAAEATLLLTTIANRREDYESGIDWGKQAIKADDGSSQAHYQYAVAIRNKMQKVSRLRAMMSLGEYKKQLARAIELDAENIDARQEQIGFFLNAPGVAGGSVEKAKEAALELQQVDWRAGTLQLAEVAERSDGDAAATPLYRQLVEKHPDDVGLQFAYANNLQACERWSDADAAFERLAAEEGPYQGVALYQRARTRILGEYDQQQAVGMLKRYLEELDEGGQPPATAAWWRLGNAYEQLGRIADARDAYRQALRIDKDYDRAKKALKALPKA